MSRTVLVAVQIIVPSVLFALNERPRKLVSTRASDIPLRKPQPFDRQGISQRRPLARDASTAENQDSASRIHRESSCSGIKFVLLTHGKIELGTLRSRIRHDSQECFR